MSISNNSSKSQKSKLIMYATGGIAIVIVLAAFGLSKKHQPPPIASGANLGGIPNIEAAPGAASSPDYVKSAINQNIKEGTEALQSGNTYTPQPVNSTFVTGSPLDAAEKDKAMQDEKRKADEAVEEAKKRLALEEESKQQIFNKLPSQPPVVTVSNTVSGVTAPKKDKKYTEDDADLISAVLGVTKAKLPSSETDFRGQTPTAAINNATGSNAVQVNGTTQVAQEQRQAFASAGTIYNAVLETAINSDEPGPILAKIVSGPLKGSRLIGTMSVVGEKIVLEFKTAKLPNKTNSIALNAVAIDPSSARTAFASDVDHHYMLKYGVLLGAAFISGYSDALAQQNQTVVTSPNGTVVTQTGRKTAGEINREALGSVAKEFAQNTRSEFANIKPTIKVNSGVAMGLLLMSDLFLDSQISQ